MAGTLPRLAAAVALIGLLPHGLAAQIVPLGPAVRADTEEGVTPGCPSLAVGPDRSFEIVWSSTAPGTAARHFSPGGEPTTPAQIRLASDRSSVQRVDRVGALPDGFQVFLFFFKYPRSEKALQRLDLTGSPAGPLKDVRFGDPVGPVLLGQDGVLYKADFQRGPKKLFIGPVLSGGGPLGQRILLNSRPIDQPAPQIAPLGGGDLAAAWTGLTTGNDPQQVIRARVLQGGVPVGQDFDVNTIPGGTKDSPPHLDNLRVVSDPSTQHFAVLWTVLEPPANKSVHWRLFDSPGLPRTPEIVATSTSPDVNFVDAALDDAGNLLLLWSPDYAVLNARLFASDGTPLGSALQLVSNPFGYSCGGVAWGGDSWLITYWDGGAGGQGEILWRRFTE